MQVSAATRKVMIRSCSSALSFLLLLVTALFYPVASFLPKYAPNENCSRYRSSFQRTLESQVSPPRAEPLIDSSLLATSMNYAEPAAKFHADMHRVLRSRQNLMSSSRLELDPLDRRNRAQVLTQDVDGAERVVSMLRHMVSIGVATEETYCIALEALAKRGRLRWKRDNSLIVCAADEVQAIMQELWDIVEGHENKDGICCKISAVSTETCNLALQAYAVCATPRGNRKYAQMAQNLLDKMESRNIEVTAQSLSHAVHAWAWQQENGKSGGCAQLAQKYFDRLQESSPSVDILQQSYHWLLEAWSKSKDAESQEKAEGILNSMIAIRSKHPDSKFPNINSYTNAILAWSKCKGENAASRAQMILEQAVMAFETGKIESEPELIAFNGVLSAWARLSRPDQAEVLLSQLQNLSQDYVELSPDVVTYTSVMQSYLRSRDKARALTRIISIIREMERIGEKDPTLKPNALSYSILLKAWGQSRHPDAAIETLKVLRKMQELWDQGDLSTKPSNIPYNIAINAIAKSQDNVNGEKAFDLLLQMQAREVCQPDIISYTSVIECYTKSNDPGAVGVAVELLEQVKSAYSETMNPKLKPNARIYSVAISATNANPTIDSVLTARKMLVEMLQLYDDTKDPDLEPSAYPFNYVLKSAGNCIGTAQDKLKAFQAAAQTYNDLRQRDSVAADSYTYAFWFKCCNNLLPMGEIRKKGLMLAFEECKAKGLVSGEALRRLIAGTPTDLARRILGLDDKASAYDIRQLHVDDLPPNWSRNVR